MPGLIKRDFALLGACALLVATVGAAASVVLLDGASGSVAGSIPVAPSAPPSAPTDTDSPAPVISAQPSPGAGPLMVSGDPHALPGLLLISDRGNSRVIELDGRGNIVWQFPPAGYRGPMPFDQNDDAFFSPDHRSISTNEEFEHTVQVIDIQARRITWSYGTPYRPGSGPNQLNGPDDAFVLPDGRVMVADIKNCRVVLITPNKHVSQLGQTGVCRHDPAHGYFASPNGDSPSADRQHVVITEIGGSWVDVFHFPDFRFEYSFHSPASYPSDATMQPDGTFLLTDYVSPGAVYRVDRHGMVLWKYANQLDHPSIAIGLPNGYISISDDYGDRVLIVDPQTNVIKWQYGIKNRPGQTAGHLYIPDGLDFLQAPDFHYPQPHGYF